MPTRASSTWGLKLKRMENRKLRQIHQLLVEQVSQLYDISLLRQQGQWKDKIESLRATADALQTQYPSGMKAWRMHWDMQLFKALEQSDYQSLLTDHQTCGALVNQNNAHWIALVKHKEQLWHVDSCYFPWPMREEDFRECLATYPSTFAVVQRGHPGE